MIDTENATEPQVILLIDAEGNINKHLDNKMKYMSKRIGGKFWEDLYQELRTYWLEKPKPESFIKGTLLNMYKKMRHETNAYEGNVDSQPTITDMVDELFPDSCFPLDKMSKLFDVSREKLREYFALRINRWGIRRIEREIGISDWQIERIEKYVKDYFTYHANEEMRKNCGYWGKRHEKVWNEGGVESTRLTTHKNPVRNFYIKEYINPKVLRSTGLPIDILTQVMELIREGYNNNQIVDFYKEEVVKNPNTGRRLTISPGKVLNIRHLLRDNPTMILFTYLAPKAPPTIKASNIVCISDLHFTCEKSEKSKKLSKYFIEGLEDVKKILDELLIAYKSAYTNDTAEETLRILERCPVCDSCDCLQVYYRNHMVSWCCHSCRTKRLQAEGEIDKPIHLPELYKKYSNSLKGLILLLQQN